MKEYTVTYQNQSKTFSKVLTLYEISLAFNVNDAMVAVINHELVALQEKISNSLTVDFLNVTHASGYKIYQAGLKYLLLGAVTNIFKDSEVLFLHSVPKGILCEIKTSKELTIEDVDKIKGEMANLVINKLPFIPYHLKPVDAYSYYKSKEQEEKAQMIQYVNSDLVTLYRLENELNYFYNFMPYDTSYLKSFELKYLQNNRLVIVCPNLGLNGKLPEYVHYDNIVNNFMDSQNWLRKLNCPYLAKVNIKVANNNIQDFISITETKFNEEILKCSDAIMKSKAKFILIAGPSSSGKTTTTKKLKVYCESKGYEVINLSTDDFFVNRKDTPLDENQNPDFESIYAIDLPYLKNFITRLLNGEEVECPQFDFIKGERKFTGHFLKVKENSIFLIEGLHCLNDELLPFIDDKYKFKVYLSPFMPLNIDRHNYVSTVDLRLIRRIIRDRKNRGQEVSNTISQWQKVRNGEEKNIFPYVSNADVIINTAMAYEVGVLKVFALPLLHSVPIDHPTHFEAKRLIKMLEPFFSISSELVPKDSIIREFID